MPELDPRTDQREHDRAVANPGLVRPPFIYLAAAVSLMSLVVIPREERYLERRFNAEYREYKAKVRRWL